MECLGSRGASAQVSFERQSKWAIPYIYIFQESLPDLRIPASYIPTPVHVSRRHHTSTNTSSQDPPTPHITPPSAYLTFDSSQHTHAKFACQCEGPPSTGIPRTKLSSDCHCSVTCSTWGCDIWGRLRGNGLVGSWTGLGGGVSEDESKGSGEEKEGGTKF